MKIYVNEQNQIKALRVNDTGDNTLTELEVDDNFMSSYCDSVIKAFCYCRNVDEFGHEAISVYPYKDFLILETIQEQDSLREKLSAYSEDIALDNDFRLTLLEI